MGTCGQMWACSQIKNFKVTAETAVAVKTKICLQLELHKLMLGVFVPVTSGETKQF